MGEKVWKDPIVEEVRKIREALGKEYDKDPKGFIDRARRDAVKAGFKLVPRWRSQKLTHLCSDKLTHQFLQKKKEG